MFKWKPKTQKAIRGSISILLVIILLPMMTFSAVVVDTSRINMAKTVMAGAGDLTMNTALANYDTILKDVYGLFAMSQEKTEEDLAKDLKEYFAKTISGYGVVSEAESGAYVESLLGSFNSLLAGTTEYENGHLSDLLKLEDLTVEADRVDNSSLASSAVLRNQIIEYMKFRAPLEFGMSFIDALKSFEVADEQMKVVDTQVKAQEGTQEVTQACKALIDLIREYDDLVKDINEGGKSVKGEVYSTDEKKVPLVDYDTQVEKYLDNWGKNKEETYTRINKLMMVFLAKAPSVDEVYLAKQKGSFIQKEAGLVHSVVYTDCGIPNKYPTLAATTEKAISQMNDQLDKPNAKAGTADHLDTLRAWANAYTQQTFIDKSAYNSDKTAFVNEDQAIQSFIQFEQFLLNEHATVKYENIQSVLKYLYALSKCFDNYENLIGKDIVKADTAYKNAKAVVTGYEKTINNAANNFASDINNINTKRANIVQKFADYEFLNKPSLELSVEMVLKKALPELKGSNYEGYYNSYLSTGKDSDMYTEFFRGIADGLCDNSDATISKVAQLALDYLDGKAKDQLTKHLTKGLSSKEKTATAELRNFFDHLDGLSKAAQAYQNRLKDYNTAKANLETAKQEAQEKKAAYDKLVEDRQTMRERYYARLKEFKGPVDAYQEDVRCYSGYIETATNIITAEATDIYNQFGKICDNIKQLNEKLDAIKTQAETTHTAVKNYLLKLDAWEKENDAYIKANGNDSFSRQTAEDIAKARTNYNLASVETLQAFLYDGKGNGICERMNAFYTYLQGDVYFKYGGKRLHEIQTAADVKEAAKNTIATITDNIITVEIAANNLKYLYKSGTNYTFVPYTLENDDGTGGQLYFLDPVLQIQFLKYLNSSYPENPPKAEKDEDGKTIDHEQDYEDTKTDLKTPDKSIDAMGAETEEAPAEGEEKPKTDKYGYSYKNITLSDGDKTNRPSNNKVKEEVNTGNSAFALSDEGQASKNVENQGNVLSSLMSGLSSAATVALENAYILTYLFENFSYNTMIQDAVIEGNKDKLSGEGGYNLATAKGLLKEETLKAYRDVQKTLSGYDKKAANNYLYGAELEYIMYGNTNPAANVSAAKASIYAIRFCFNCIYAFTDSTIRNTTMAAGLAVQAATLGVVPYQVVQIVLQLAMAAAESAIDLDMMMSGLDVAVVKTRDTWMLSLSSAVNTAKDFLVETAADYAENAIKGLTGSLQGVVDAGADKLNGAIGDLTDNLQLSAEQAVRDTADQIFTTVTSKIEEALNAVQHEVPALGVSPQTVLIDKLDALKGTLGSELEETFGSNDIGKKVLDYIKKQKYIDIVINSVKDKVNAVVPEGTAIDMVSDRIMGAMTDIKREMVSKVTNCVDGILRNVEDLASDAVTKVQGKINAVIGEKGEKIAEETADAIKESVTNITNEFMNDTLGKVDMPSGKDATNRSVGSLIKFGYKEYLMLFVYIGLCANGTAENNKILLRTADLIQFNIVHAGKGADFTHNKKDAFLMKNACTYIHLTATAKLDMFFVDLGMFSSVMDPVGTGTGQETAGEVTVESDGTGTAIRYEGLLGY